MLNRSRLKEIVNEQVSQATDQAEYLYSAVLQPGSISDAAISEHAQASRDAIDQAEEAAKVFNAEKEG